MVTYLDTGPQLAAPLGPLQVRNLRSQGLIRGYSAFVTIRGFVVHFVQVSMIPDIIGRRSCQKARNLLVILKEGYVDDYNHTSNSRQFLTWLFTKQWRQGSSKACLRRYQVYSVEHFFFFFLNLCLFPLWGLWATQKGADLLQYEH